MPIAYGSAVYVAHWNQSRERARDESLVGIINVGEGKVLLINRNAVLPAQFDDFPASNAVHAVLPGRCPHLTATYDEEVRCVAGADKAVDIEHQRFICARIQRLSQCDHLMQLAMAVETRVQVVGRAAPYCGGEQADAVLSHVRIGLFVLRDYHDGRTANYQARVLRGRFLDASGDHEAHVHLATAFHLVCFDYLVEPGSKFVARYADIEGDGLCPLIEPRQVLLQKDQYTVVQADALPDTISDQVTTIEHRYLRLVAREKLAI